MQSYEGRFFGGTIRTDLNAKFEFRYTASLMFYLAYGRRVKTLDDPLCMAHDLTEECE